MYLADWMNGIVKMCMNAYRAGQPCDICYGTVVSENPPAVNVEELKMTLKGRTLLIPEHLKDRILEITVGTEKGTVRSPGIMKAGTRVILVRKTGGQSYAVIGKVE